MNSLRIILQNTIFLSLDRLIRGFLLMLLTIWVARMIGVEAFGVYGLALVVGGIFRVAVDFGTSFLTAHEIAKNQAVAGRMLTHGLVVKSLLAVLGIGIIALVAYQVYPPAVAWAVVIGSVAAIPRLFVEFVGSFFSGHERMKMVSVIMVTYMLAVFILTAGLLWLGVRDPAELLLGYLGGGLAAMLLAAVYLFSQLKIPFAPFAWTDVQKLLVMSIPFGLYFLSDIIYFHTDVIMLSLFKGKSAVGLYQAPIKIIQLLEAAPLLIASAAMPTFSRLFSQKAGPVRDVLSPLLNLAILLSVPLGVGGVLVGDRLMILVYGPEFARSGALFALLAMILPFRFLIILLGMALTAMGNQTKRLGIVALSAALNIILNFLLIPRYDIFGAAVASLASAIFLCTGLAAHKALDIDYTALVSMTGKAAAAAVLMAAGLLLVRDAWPLWLSVLTGAAAYFLMMGGLKGFSFIDLRRLRDMLRKPGGQFSGLEPDA